MNKFENYILKLSLGGIAIFAIGLFVGYQLNHNTITSLQGFLFNAAGYATDPNATDSNATDSNATDSNATDSNATDSNATDSNATSSNATDANASLTDNVIYLANFSLKNSTVKLGDKVYLDLVTNGACNSGASIVFQSESGLFFTTTVESINDNPYIVIPKNIVATTYHVTDVLLVGKNNDNTTFTKQYSSYGNNVYDFEASLIIQKEEEEKVPEEVEKVLLKSIFLETSKAKMTDKVYVTLDSDLELNSVKLTFTSTSNKTFHVYVQSLTNKPYFEIPTTVESDTYSLVSATLISQDETVIYSLNGEEGSLQFAFHSSLQITNENEDNFIYNNEDINANIVAKLYSTNENTNITINADAKTLINSELFDVIKGKEKTLTINYHNNQIVFNGKNINSSKTIDVAMLVKNVTSNEDINKLVAKGIIVSFPDNGNLPGDALIRIKATKNIQRVLEDTIHIYYFNETDNNFFEIQTDVKKTEDDYYEFTINHNSNYLLVNEKLDKQLIAESSSSNVVSFQKSNKINLLLIAIGILVIIIVTVGIIILKKKKAEEMPK